MTMLTPLFLALSLTQQPRLTDLSSDAAELRDAFNHDRGFVRMILIVSPT
jgi:hypothetical protein